MQLEEFFRYKNQLMEDLVTNENIVKLIDCRCPFANAEELIYSKIFPYEYIPETVEDAATYICCDVDITDGTDIKTFFTPIIYIWVFTHRSLLRLPEGGVRTDELCSEIAKVINGSRFYGLGELYLYSVKRFAPMTDYQGKVMTFYARDYNRIHDIQHPVPKNRIRGK